MTLKPHDEIHTWAEWQAANTTMREAVENALVTKNAAADADYAAASNEYSSLLKQWKRLKVLGLELVDAEIAKSGVPGQITQANAAIKAKAEEIAKLAKSLNDVAKLVQELASIGNQFDGLIGLFTKLAL